MAHAEPFPVTIASITPQVGWHVLAFQTLTNWNDVSLRETLPVWSLSMHGSTTTATIRELARDTKRWHHQLYNGGNVVGYARSQPTGVGASGWQVCEVFASDIASRIADSIAWIDRNVTGDPIARLLVVPAYRLYAIWLLYGADDAVIVADRPARFASLELNKQYTGSEFLTAIRTLPRIVGFI